jgi:hypothetical protein
LTRRLAALAALLVVAFPVGAVDADAPLRVRNLAPAAIVYGLPAPQGVILAPGERGLALHIEHANNFTARNRDGVEVFFDGSTTVASVAFRQGLRERWEWGVEVPLVDHSGGFTDRFIDNFHDLFGFPDGGRSGAPRNRLQYRIAVDGETLLDIERRRRGLGDLRIWGGYRLMETTRRSAALRAQLKLPTGDVDDLAGSGAADLALWAELTERGWLDRLGVTVTLMGGLLFPGDGDLLASRQRATVAVGHLGLHYPLGERVVVRAQVDGHSKLLDTGTRQLGGASLQGTLGGSIALPRGLRLDLALSEDMIVNSAPDVVFLVSLGRRW